MNKNNAYVNPQIEKMSNILTDMIMRGDSKEEIDNAVKHSMIVMDDEKIKKYNS